MSKRVVPLGMGKSYSDKSSKKSQVNEGGTASQAARKSAIGLPSPLSYEIMDDKGLLDLIKASRQGIKYSYFQKLMKGCPFTFEEWSAFLHLSSRSMLRYKKDKKTFDPIQSEKILQIALLYAEGTRVFGEAERFDQWLDSQVVALGGLKPKELLDNNFGITLIKDQLGRIAHGILA